MTVEAPSIHEVLGVPELLALLSDAGSIFVIGQRANIFWEKGVSAYPFPQGTMLLREDADEVRYPTLFVRGDQGKYSVSRIPAWFGETWFAHLEGIVESTPGFHLPDYAFPSCQVIIDN